MTPAASPIKKNPILDIFTVMYPMTPLMINDIKKRKFLK